MEIVIVVLLVALIAAVVILVPRQAGPSSQPAPQTDQVAIIEAVKAAIDIGAISTGVRGQLETQLHQTATEVLAKANEEARKQADERLAAQRASLADQTKVLLTPFQEQMAKLGGEVKRLHDDNSRRFGSVDEAVKGLARQTQALNNVLSSAQGRGNWGERMLEDILAQSGFIRGVNYEKLETLTEGGRPDFSFFLPPDRVLYLDSKFPLENYVAYYDAEDDATRNGCRDRFIKNVEDRVKELAKREYAAQSTRSALDYVLLFIPNEAVLGFVQQHKPSLIDDAIAKQVVLCSPLTLYAFLGVVRQATDSFKMQESANEVLSLLQQFNKAWKHYSTNLVEIQKRFDGMQDKLRAVTTGQVWSRVRVPLDKIEAIAQERGIVASDETLLALTEAIGETDDDADSSDPTAP